MPSSAHEPLLPNKTGGLPSIAPKSSTAEAPYSCDPESNAAAEEFSHPTPKHFGFSVNEEVLFESLGTVEGFNGDAVKVRFMGQTIDLRPCELRRHEVGHIMHFMFQLFCGYADILFLRETFTTPWAWAENLEMVNRHVTEEEKLLTDELRVHVWTKEQTGVLNAILNWTFGLYLRTVLAPSVHMYHKYSWLVQLAMVILFVPSICFVCHAFSHLKDLSDEKAKEQGEQAFHAIAAAPITWLFLLLCFHMIMILFAGKQASELSHESTHIPYPLTYTIFIGKGFMIARMFMACSSKNLGVSIDYFVRQEAIVIFLHATLAIFVGDPKPVAKGKGCSYAKQLSYVFLVIVAIDGLKSIVCFLHWFTYQPGHIAKSFNRHSNRPTMIVTGILIHVILDTIHFAVTAFTMFIGRMYTAVTHRVTSGMDPAPLDTEIPEWAHQLAGQWKTGRGFTASFELFTWKVKVPSGVILKEFELGSVFDWSRGSPLAKMTVKVPSGKKAGDELIVTELRVTHQTLGVRSVNLADAQNKINRIELFKEYKIREIDARGELLQFEGDHQLWQKITSESAGRVAGTLQKWTASQQSVKSVPLSVRLGLNRGSVAY